MTDVVELVDAARYSAADVARVVLGKSQRWFSEHRAALERDGFPRPISRVGRPAWWGKDLRAWLERDKRPTPRPRAERTESGKIIDLLGRRLQR